MKELSFPINNVRDLRRFIRPFMEETRIVSANNKLISIIYVPSSGTFDAYLQVKED